ncbi:PCYCGC motif-containing (lipo)protein [Fictibacillus nanhaiensis]
MKKRQLILTMTLGVSFLISGCGSKSEDEHKNHQEGSSAKQEASHEGHENHLPNGDIQELTASMDVLPGFLDKQPEEIAAIYAEVPKYKELLETMPCFCGCGESAGHKDNYDCFVSENKEDGKIVWDDHGTKCGTCLEIAAISMSASADGKTPVEIRNMIDEKYKEGYAEPTPTPMPAS